MAEYTALAPLFTDIANAIRSKTGETGAITANSFPSSITNIKTSRIKIIQVSTLTNDQSQSVYTFTFPVEFAPTGFIGCAADIVINNYSSNTYSMVSPNDYVTSFSYIDNKFISIVTHVYTATNGTATSFAYVDMSLGTNYDLSYYLVKRFNVTISSTQVSIANSSSNYKIFFVQGNNSKGYWNVVYWA